MAKKEDNRDVWEKALDAINHPAGGTLIGGALGGAAGRVMSRSKALGGRGVFRRQGEMKLDPETAKRWAELAKRMPPGPERDVIAGAVNRYKARSALTGGGIASGSFLGAIGGEVARRNRERNKKRK